MTINERLGAQFRLDRRLLVSVVSCCFLVASLVAGAPAGRAATGDSVIVTRGGQSATVPFTISSPGEVVLRASVSAPGVSWQRVGDESAVVSLYVDGRYESDLVIMSHMPQERSVALGHVKSGHHNLIVRFDGHRSPPGATSASLDSMSFADVAPADAGYVASRHAPVLYGRSLSNEGGPFQNAYTDTPLVAWHESAAASTPGDRILQYSVVWSNEDGGTSPPALMARWGRTTDIEWIYQVEVDARGRTVPGTAVFQGKNHATKPFKGDYENGHPILQTCTSNNNVCDKVKKGYMRFFLDANQIRPVDRAREVLMDDNPWTYWVMAQEMIREGDVESPSDPLTPALGDQRTYLYVEVKKDTIGASNDGSSWDGLALGVVMKGDSTIYRSDHFTPGWSIQRDLPAATTVELPAGTSAADVEKVVGIRVPTGKKDTGASVHVTAINRAFFLGADYRPNSSFIRWTGSVTLTPQEPQRTLWTPS